MVLEDHKKRGKKLIPPMMERPVEQTHWHIDRLPEFFWLAFIGGRIGFPETLELACSMAKEIESTIMELRGDGKRFRPYVLSENNECLADEKLKAREDCDSSEWLRRFGPHIADMTRIWTRLPIAYLSTSSGSQSTTHELRDEVKAILRACISRHQQVALTIQAIVVQIELCTKKLMLPDNAKIPDIHSLVTSTSSANDRLAAGFVVTTCNSVIMARRGPDHSPDYAWQREFWNTCYHLEPSDHG